MKSVKSLLIVAVASIFLALFLSLAAAGVLTDESRGVSRSLAVVRAYTTAPRDLQEDVEPSFKERVLTPLLDWSLAVGRKLTPDDYVERIRRRLDLAGNPPGWTVDRVTSLKFLGFAAALAVSLLGAFILGLGLLPMLAVCVGDEHELGRRGADAGLDGGAVALVVRVTNHARAGGCGAHRRVVYGAVVDHQHVAPRSRRTKRRHHLADRVGLVQCRDHDGHGRGVSQRAAPPRRPT